MTITPTYIGFWKRIAATIIDTLLLSAVLYPPLIFIYGWEYFDSKKSHENMGSVDFILSGAIPALLIVAFWIIKQATPGKMLFSAKIVDAKTGGKPSTDQCLLRYAASYISVLCLGIGCIWIAFDKRKQGWHDKLAGTVVIKSESR